MRYWLEKAEAEMQALAVTMVSADASRR
jgi:hypothetical protein